MPDPTKYALSDVQHDTIFRRDVIPEYFSDLSAIPHQPTAVILGGQPGSGKSALLDRATSDLQASGATVVINGDDFRAFHPAYTRLQQTDPENAAFYTDRDSGRWVEKTIEHAKSLGVNMVIESTMRNPATFEKTSESLREAGYRVEARAMAVPAAESWQGVHLRYEGMLERGEQGRFTKREAHDAGYKGVPLTLRAIEKHGWAQRITLEVRSGEIIYDNRHSQGRWLSPPRAADVLEWERTRPRTPDEIQQHEHRWQKIDAQQSARGLAQVERQTIRSQAPALPQSRQAVTSAIKPPEQRASGYWSGQIHKARDHSSGSSVGQEEKKSNGQKSGPKLR